MRLKYYLVVLLLLSNGVFAAIPSYYHKLSEKTGVSVYVILALALTETNTSLDNGTSLPWPYSLNLNGKSELFLTNQEMLDKANYYLSRGIIHFDCGLFQINWKWNGRTLANTVREICPPKKNGPAAIQLLKNWYQTTGDWVKAAGKYHNPANKNGAADKYMNRFRINLRRAEKMANG